MNCMELPPSITIPAPVMWAAALEAKKTAIPPISSGVPTLPVGWTPSSASRPCSNAKAVMREGKTPGQMALTRTKRSAREVASVRVRWSEAALEGWSVDGNEMKKETGREVQSDDDDVVVTKGFPCKNQ